MMHTAGIRGLFGNAAWHDLWGKLAPACGYRGCVHAGSKWARMRRRSRGVRMLGVRYCRTECLEWALAEALGRTRSVPYRAAIVSHRIPLGLLLLSRQQLTAAQLRAALQAQRNAGRASSQCAKKIGVWLQQLGFTTEQQVTAALARQWSCPLLRTSPVVNIANRSLHIPVLLLEFFQMIPVEFVEATGILLIAFSEGIDYMVLYAIEQMLGYRTEACLVCPSVLQKNLQELARRARHRGASDVVIEHVEDVAECARIIGSYSAKVGAEEVRFARCGEHLWIRLVRPRKEAVNLVLRVKPSSLFSVLSSQ